MNNKKLVALGGGNGTTQVIRACQGSFEEVTAIVGVTDTGRSTGVARQIGHIPAPGDLRNTIARLARDPDDLFVKLLQYRFTGEGVKELEGMAIGNLLLAALAQMTGDFSQAVGELRKLAGCEITVLPVSNVDTQLCAELEDGTITRNELETRGLNKSPIKRLFLSDSPAPALPEVIKAIKSADLVVLGPGSFYTSVLATLVFDGVRDALEDTRAKVVYVCNTTTQPGQSDNFTAYDFISKMNSFLGNGVLDVALVHTPSSLSDETVAHYGSQGLIILQPQADEIQKIKDLGIEAIAQDFAEEGTITREIWNKLDTVRHDPSKLAHVLNRMV